MAPTWPAALRGAALVALGLAALAQGETFVAVLDCTSAQFDGGFNQMMSEGLVEAVETANRDGKAVQYRFVSTCKAEGGLAALLSDATLDVQHVFLNGFNVVGEYDDYITTYKNVRFTAIDEVPQTLASNVQAALFAEDEGSFVIGALAGLYAKQADPSELAPVVGAVFGTPFPPLKRLRNGFLLGVRHKCPNCIVISDYIWSFSNPELGERAAANLTELGAKIIFAAGGETGVGALTSSSKLSVPVLGVDTDQFQTVFNGSSTEGKWIVSSMLKKVDATVKRVVKDHLSNVFQGGKTITMDYGNDGIGLAECHEACAFYDRVEVAKVEENMEVGVVRSGVDSASGQVLQSSFYNLETLPDNSWTPVQTFGEQPDAVVDAASGTVAMLGDTVMLMYGGKTENAPNGTNTLWSFNAGSMSWARPMLDLSSEEPGNRHSATLTGVQCDSNDSNYAILIGGVNGLVLVDDVWRLDLPDTVSSPLSRWTKLEPVPDNQGPGKREGHSAVAVNCGIYVFGGRGESGALQNDMWYLDTKTGMWDLICSNCGPPNRWYSTLVFLSDQKALYLHGGRDGQRTLLRDTYRFDLNTKEWTRKAEAPVSRAQHIAVEFLVRPPGGERQKVMAVSGGDVGEDTTQRERRSVAYYLPADDEWILVASYQVVKDSACPSSTAAPSADEESGLPADFVSRRQHVAFALPDPFVSRSDRLAVFGGINTNTGGRLRRFELFHPSETGVIPNLNQLGSLVGALYSMFVICVLLALSLIVWALKKKEHQVLRSAQLPFLLMIAVGVIISSLSIVTIAVDDSGDEEDLALNGDYTAGNAACMASVWLFATGFICSFAPLFGKMWRVHRIFSDTKMKRIIISNGQLIRICLGLLVIEWGIVLAWQIQSPLRYERRAVQLDEYENVLESVGTCRSDNSTPYLFTLLAFHLCILFYGNFLSWKARKIDVRFQESSGISMALIANLQVLALSIPVLILVSDNPMALATVLSGVIFLNNVSILCCIFIPKVLMVRSGKYDNGSFTDSSRDETIKPRSSLYGKSSLNNTYDGSHFASSYVGKDVSDFSVGPPDSPAPFPPAELGSSQYKYV